MKRPDPALLVVVACVGVWWLGLRSCEAQAQTPPRSDVTITVDPDGRPWVSYADEPAPWPSLDFGGQREREEDRRDDDRDSGDDDE